MVTKEKILAALEGTKLPRVRITPDPEKTPGPTDSKFGGDFYLPAGTEAPDMEFLAQINFAQVPHLEGFPGKGLLQFFLCTEDGKFEGFIEDESAFSSDSGFFQVRWYPEHSEDAPVHEDEVPEERWPMEKVTGGMKFEPGEETATLSFGGGDSDFTADLGFEDAADMVSDIFIEDGDEEDEDEDGAEDEDEGYDLSDCGGVDGFVWDFGNWGFKLGGHPSVRYDDLRLDKDAYQEYTTLLFQFDLTALDESEGEADTFCFFIRPEDLNARRFDDILMVHHNCY